ncbi:hypothetical protein JTE90_002991 [Oedothorax gibbosus]|uniref:Uncharacterized protein n=1 Tax=Oedothorax gibbosus TaxID=931172 RepID=A0AAV6VGC3_9ARAC|nr:hypothetical protein JTE90_002991 [Oedothorax gibbosus]
MVSFRAPRFCAIITELTSIKEKLVDHFVEDIVSDIPDLKYVYFGENKISQLSSTLLGYAIDNFDFLILNGNSLNCGCAFKVLAEKDNPTVDGNCVYPDDKKGLLLANLTTEHFSTCS